MSDKNRKITVLVEPKKFDRFSKYCEQQGYKKSTLINKLISDFLSAADIKLENPNNDK
jgi:hypothetical protein